MPVLVVKANEGFADRMSFLSHCIRYCLDNNTALCVDWKDGTWGGLEVDFHDIFELVGVKTMKKEAVVKLMASGKVKVHPPCWTAEDVWVPISTKTHDEKYSGNLFYDDSEVKKMVKKIDADVIVTNSRGFRAWFAEDLLKHVRIRPEISEQMRPFFKDFNRECLVVHLRGTDRFDDKFCRGAIDTAVQFPADLPIYVVTDQLKLFEQFQHAIPRAQLFNPKGEVLKLPKNMRQGTHLTTPPILNKYGCNKKQMLIDLLVDFVAIWAGKYSLGTKESYFYKLARGFALYNVPGCMETFIGFHIR